MPSEYDYRFNSEKRDKICTLLKCLWAMKKKDNLPIFDIQENHLKNFTTTERDVKRGIDKFPPKDYRNTIEDLIDEVVPVKKAAPALGDDMGFDNEKEDDDNMDFGEMMQTVADVKKMRATEAVTDEGDEED